MSKLFPFDPGVQAGDHFFFSVSADSRGIYLAARPWFRRYVSLTPAREKRPFLLFQQETGAFVGLGELGLFDPSKSSDWNLHAHLEALGFYAPADWGEIKTYLAVVDQVRIGVEGWINPVSGNLKNAVHFITLETYIKAEILPNFSGPKKVRWNYA